LRIDVNPDANLSRRCAMKRLLLAAAGLSVIAGPMAASAQSQPHWRGNHQDRQNAGQAPANRPDNRAAPQTFRAPQQNVRRFQSAPTRGGYGNQNANPTWRGARPNGMPARVPNGSGQYQSYGNTGQVQTYRGGQYQYRNGYAGQTQYRSGGQYQSRNGYAGRNLQNWSGRNFRLQGDWWRGRTGFNGYYGHRAGFWFAPGWGYYQVDPRWYDFDWAVGAVVPYELQSYAISDPYAYGLPPAPYGCEWIFLGDQIALIDLSSGQIVQIAGAY
jgi:Ni/Co efflux regulator RcnB